MKKNTYRQKTTPTVWVSSGKECCGFICARNKLGQWHTIPADYFKTELQLINHA